MNCYSESLRLREEMMKDDLEKARVLQQIRQEELETKLVEAERKITEEVNKSDSLNHQLADISHCESATILCITRVGRLLI